MPRRDDRGRGNAGAEKGPSEVSGNLAVALLGSHLLWLRNFGHWARMGCASHAGLSHAPGQTSSRGFGAGWLLTENPVYYDSPLEFETSHLFLTPIPFWLLTNAQRENRETEKIRWGEGEAGAFWAIARAWQHLSQREKTDRGEAKESAQISAREPLSERACGI